MSQLQGLRRFLRVYYVLLLIYVLFEMAFPAQFFGMLTNYGKTAMEYYEPGRLGGFVSHIHRHDTVFFILVLHFISGSGSEQLVMMAAESLLYTLILPAAIMPLWIHGATGMQNPLVGPFRFVAIATIYGVIQWKKRYYVPTPPPANAPAGISGTLLCAFYVVAAYDVATQVVTCFFSARLMASMGADATDVALIGSTFGQAVMLYSFTRHVIFWIFVLPCAHAASRREASHIARAWLAHAAYTLVSSVQAVRTNRDMSSADMTPPQFVPYVLQLLLVAWAVHVNEQAAPDAAPPARAAANKVKRN